MLVDPLSIHEIQGAMATLVTSDSMRDSLRGRAKKQAARFRWTESARETLAFFREVVS